MLLIAIDTCKNLILKSADIDIFQVLFETAMISSFVTCLFPIKFTPKHTNTPTFNIDPRLDAQHIAANNQQLNISSYLSDLIKRRNQRAQLTETKTNFL